MQARSARNTQTTLPCPLDNVNDTEIYIYSASQLASVGDLSGLMVGYADFSKAVKLQSLKIGDASASYSNGNLTELYLGNNELLRTIDVRNCPLLSQAVDISGKGRYHQDTASTGDADQPVCYRALRDHGLCTAQRGEPFYLPTGARRWWNQYENTGEWSASRVPCSYHWL